MDEAYTLVSSLKMCVKKNIDFKMFLDCLPNGDIGTKTCVSIY